MKPLIEFEGHSEGIRCFSWNKKTNLIVSSAVDNSVKIWTGSDFQLVKEYNIRSNLMDVAWINDEMLVCCCYQEDLVFVNTNSNEIIREDFPASAIAVSNDKKTLFLGYDGKRGQLMNLADKKVVHGRSPDMIDFYNGILMAVWSPNDDYVAIVQEVGPIRIINQKGELFYEVYTTHLHLTWVDWSSDGEFLIIGDRYGKVHVWNLKTKKIIKDERFYDLSLYEDKVEESFVEAYMKTVGKYQMIDRVKFSPDGKYYAVVHSESDLSDFYNESEITIVNFPSNKIELSFANNRKTTALIWTPDEKIILSGNYKGQISVWEVEKERD